MKLIIAGREWYGKTVQTVKLLACDYILTVANLARGRESERRLVIQLISSASLWRVPHHNFCPGQTDKSGCDAIITYLLSSMPKQRNATLGVLLAHKGTPEIRRIMRALERGKR